MTERCQTKFTEKFENQNYVIYVGILVGSLAVLYFYRFHFATIAFSYVLGCLACYYGLNSNILDRLVNKIKCHSVLSGAENEGQEDRVESCATCGSSNCPRHDSGAASEPWVGLQVHKQLDQAIEEFYNAILVQFISSWYSNITQLPFFIDELRYQLRYASSCLLRRAVKINYSRLITERLVPCALRHLSLDASRAPPALHPAAASRAAELRYLRHLATAVMPYLLNHGELHNDVFRVLVREIFAGWVLLPLTDLLADPYILNALIILATGDETLAQLPATPDYRVEFLSTFVRHNDSAYSERSRLLRLDLELVISAQEHLYAFMQHMKTTSHIHLLQLYKDIKLLQTKILNPDLKPSEQAALYKEGFDILARHGDLRGSGAEEVRNMLRNGDDVKRLQTSPALYEAAKESYTVLEKVVLPRYLHSEEFYKLLIGTRIPTGYQKQKKPSVSGLRPRGLLLESAPGDDAPDNIHILRYLDSLAAEDATREDDLSAYKVILTDVETRLQAPPRQGTVRVFTVTVASPRLWHVERSEHDFHLLRSKLLEFHGEQLLSDLQLPSRKDNSPNETLRYKYEDFLQRVLQQSLLQTSQLLHLFLTVHGNFSLVVQASAISVSQPDLGNIYQSVTHKLRKEKGQHLETFLKNFLVSSDMERYQALKQGTHVEEALEVIEDEEIERVQVRHINKRDIREAVFGNNFDVEPTVELRDLTYQDKVVGFTQCLMYLLVKVIGSSSCVAHTVGSVLGAARRAADAAFGALLARALPKLLSETRLAHLVRLGTNLLFNKKESSSRSEPRQQRAQAHSQLLGCAIAAAPGVARALDRAFALLQRPQFNKQLVYNLLDLCIMELFPELCATDNKSRNEPKS